MGNNVARAASESSDRWDKIENHLKENGEKLQEIAINTAVMSRDFENHKSDKNIHASAGKILTAIAAVVISIVGVLKAVEWAASKPNEGTAVATVRP